jgi:hypothetical protein
MATLYESLTILPLLRNLTTTASGRIDPPEPGTSCDWISHHDRSHMYRMIVA